MICPICGAQIQDGSRFCTGCGSNLTLQQQAPVTPEFSPNEPMANNNVFPASQIPPEQANYAAQVPQVPDIAYDQAAEQLQQAAPAPEAAPNKQDLQYASNYAPAPGSTPAKAPEKKEKKSGGFMRILPWILVGVLALGLILLGVLGNQEYNAVADERDQYYRQAAAANDEIDSLLADSEALIEECESNKKENEKLNDLLKDKDAEIESLNEVLEGDSTILEYYDDILWYAESYNIGGTAKFGAEPAVIVVSNSEGKASFTLNTQFENGSITMTPYGYSTEGDFTEDNWGESTTIDVKTFEPGVSMLEFSLEDGSYPTFGVLVIVTD